MGKSTKLKPENKFRWHELIDKRFLAVYIALALVLVINQVVFSVLLTNRNTAKADTIVFGNDTIGDTNYPELVDQISGILPPADRDPNVLAVDEINGYAYIGNSNSGIGPLKIIRIKLSDYTRDGEINVNSYGTAVQTALVDNTGTYAYFSFNTMPTKVIRVRLSDFTIQGEVDLIGSNNYTAVIDNTNGFAYYGTNLLLGEGGIERVDLSDFTYDSWLNPGQDGFRASAIDEANNSVYFADANMGGDSANVYKIDTSSFTLVGVPITLVGTENVDLNGLGIDGDNMWLSDQSYPAKLIKIDLTTFTRVPGGDIAYEDVTEHFGPPPVDLTPLYINGTYGLKIDTVRHIGYLSIDPYTSPPDYVWPAQTLLQIDLATGAPTPLMLDSLTGGYSGAFGIDFTNQKAYVSGAGYPAYLEKVDLTTFTRETVLPLAVTLQNSGGSVIDTANGYLYVVSQVDPPIITKINLVTFALEDTLFLDNDLYTLPHSAGIDMADGYAYFGVTLRSIPGSPDGLLKIDIDPTRTFGVVEDVSLSPYVAGQILIDPDNNKAYIGDRSGPPNILKVDLNSPMTIEDTVVITSSFAFNEGLNTGVIDPVNHFAYFGNYHSDLGSGRIFKIDISPTNFVQVAELDFPTDTSIRLFKASVIDAVNGYAYFFANDPFIHTNVIKIDLNTFTQVSEIVLPLIDADGGYAAIDLSQGYAFYCTNAKINKIDIDPSRTFALSSQVDITAKGDILIDTAKGFFYLVTNRSTPVGIYKYGYTLAGYVQAYKVTLAAPVPEVDYFRFYSNVDSGSLRFALYDDSKNLLWQSNEINNTVAGSWMDIPVSNGSPASIVSLPAGDYYLAFQTNTPDPVAAQISGDEGFKFATGYGSFPAAITGGTPTTTGYSYYGAFVSSSQVGGTAPDLVHPGDVTNLQVKADSTGKVTLTWIDPTDSDLKEIVIAETLLNGATQTTTYAKGTQIAVLTNRLIGSEYEYLVKARDNSGLESRGVTVEITIPATGEVSASPLVPSEEVSELTLPDGVNIGDLIKVADSTTVYFVDADKRRHTFPNEATYFSYFTSFANIKTLPLSTMSLVALGQNVTVRPGTWLVKIQTDPKVYAVEPYGLLRYVSSVDIAEKLYGTNWATKIIDISPAFFVDYQFGDPISTLAHPAQAVIKYQNDVNAYYIDQGKKQLISSAVFANNKFQAKFILTNFDQAITYPDGDPLAAQKIEDIISIR